MPNKKCDHCAGKGYWQLCKKCRSKHLIRRAAILLSLFSQAVIYKVLLEYNVSFYGRLFAALLTGIAIYLGIIQITYHIIEAEVK